MVAGTVLWDDLAGSLDEARILSPLERQPLVDLQVVGSVVTTSVSAPDARGLAARAREEEEERVFGFEGGGNA